MWKYFKRWLHTALTNTYGIADFYTGIVGTILGVVIHFAPTLEAKVNSLLWIIPVAFLGTVFAARLLLAPYWMAKKDKEAKDALDKKLAKINDKQAHVDRLSEFLSDGIRDIWNSFPKNDSEMAALVVTCDKWRNEVEAYLLEHFTKTDLLHFSRLGVIPLIGRDGAYSSAHEKILREYAVKESRLREIVRDHNITHV